jgi:hypothetical protein
MRREASHPFKPLILSSVSLETVFQRIAFVDTSTNDTNDNILDMR